MAGLFKSLFEKKGADVGTAGTAVKPPASGARGVPAGVPVHVTDETFGDLVLRAPLPVMVEFWAPWCGPCRLVAPIVEDLARKYGGRAAVAKINADENLRVAGELNVMGIPTVILFKNGQEVDRLVGYSPGYALEEKLQAILD